MGLPPEEERRPDERLSPRPLPNEPLAGQREARLALSAAIEAISPPPKQGGPKSRLSTTTIVCLALIVSVSMLAYFVQVLRQDDSGPPVFIHVGAAGLPDGKADPEAERVAGAFVEELLEGKYQEAFRRTAVRCPCMGDDVPNPLSSSPERFRQLVESNPVLMNNQSKLEFDIDRMSPQGANDQKFLAHFRGPNRDFANIAVRMQKRPAGDWEVCHVLIGYVPARPVGGTNP